MTDALLVADQHIDGGFLVSAFSKCHARGAELNPDDQTLHVRDFHRPGENLPIPTGFNYPVRGSSTTVAAHLSGAEHALELLQPLGRRAQRDRQFHQEMKWLAENGHRFRSRWIALEGDRLLADGFTSKEVFLKVAERPQPPLVIRVDEEELPFAGW